jgi:hypothetical protein
MPTMYSEVSKTQPLCEMLTATPHPRCKAGWGESSLARCCGFQGGGALLQDCIEHIMFASAASPRSCLTLWRWITAVRWLNLGFVLDRDLPLLNPSIIDRPLCSGWPIRKAIQLEAT